MMRRIPRLGRAAACVVERLEGRMLLSGDGAESEAPPGGFMGPVASAPAPGAELVSTPVELVATAVTDTEINLTWERAGTGETSITIWRSTGGGAWAKLTTLAAGSNIFTDTSCYPQTTYTYRLTADNAQGSSAPTAEVSATTKVSGATQPVAVGLTATAASPTTVDLSWQDGHQGSHIWIVERSSDAVSYTIIATVDAAGAPTMGYKDVALTPASTYQYRIRYVSGWGYGNYTNPASVTTPARAANVPAEPTNVSATVNSATGVTVSWTDSNAGAAQYLVETTPFYWNDYQAQWAQVGQTAAGATSITVSTTAEKAMYVRVRALNPAGGQLSEYTPRVIFRTASAGTIGGPKVYKIGPGQTYASLGALNWSKLGPGDTVLIYPRKSANGDVIPYFEKPLISVRGTASAPITITGVADPTTGQLPIIDGTNAVTHSQWRSHYLPLQDLSLMLIGTRTDNDGAWSPGHLKIANLEIRNGYRGNSTSPNTYKSYDGSTRQYGIAWGIYLEKGDNITIQGCVVHGNNGGVFGAGQGDHRNLENLTFDSCYFHGNGTIDSSQEHSTYIEAINTVYQYNRYGPLRAGSGGGGLKDRSAGTIVRYNRLEGGARLLDLVEAQNYLHTTFRLVSYRRTHVYGNLFYNVRTGGAVSPIHYGADQGYTPFNRKGTLHFHNNTFINRMDQSEAWRITIFDLPSSGESVDARNNIFKFETVSSPYMPDIDLLTDVGVAYFGSTWINQSWSISRDGGATFAGHIAGTDRFIGNAQNNPGFFGGSTREYHLSTSSQAIDQGMELPADVPPVLRDIDGDLRPRGAAPDLGADELSSTTFEFARPTYAIAENKKLITITVLRLGENSSPASVAYGSSNLTAHAGSDYVAVSGWLSFAAGETTKTFTLAVPNDLAVEPDETVKLSLSRPSTGASLGTQSSAILSILNDDAGPADTTAPVPALAPLPTLRWAGGTSYKFTVSYTDNQLVDFTTADSWDILVTGPGGFTQLAGFFRIDAAADGATRAVTYRLTPPGGTWDSADNGVYTVALRKGQLADVAGNTAARATLGSFRVDIAPAAPRVPTTAPRPTASPSRLPHVFGAEPIDVWS